MKFQSHLIQIDWELWAGLDFVKKKIDSRLVICTHGCGTVTWKSFRVKNSRVPWKLTVKRPFRIHSNNRHFLLLVQIVTVLRRCPHQGITTNSIKLSYIFLLHWAKKTLISCSYTHTRLVRWIIFDISMHQIGRTIDASVAHEGTELILSIRE